MRLLNVRLHKIMGKIVTLVTAGLILMISIVMAQIVNARDTDFDCSRSFCGCSTDIEIKYEAAIVSADSVPQPNIKVICLGKGLLGVSNKLGKVDFVLNTTVSPGCGLVCGKLHFVKEDLSNYESWLIDLNSSNSNRVVLGSQHLEIGEKKDGKKHGIWQGWCPDGKQSYIGNYQDDLKHGEWFEWYCTGRKKSQGEYRYGKKEGVWKEWYESDSGQIKNQSEWHDDKWHGKMISWYPDGHIESESEFRDGKYYGVRKYYSRDGRIEYIDSSGHIIKTE